MTRRLVLVVCLAGAVALPAHAGWPPPADDRGFDYRDPQNWPNDPGYAERWNYWSFVPATLVNQVDDVTRRLGTGMHVDRAWAKTTGRPEVLIAVTDSGILWSRGDLVNRLFLNRGELPPPSGCARAGTGSDAYDVNGDGRFNVQDYTRARGHEAPTIATVCDTRLLARTGTGRAGLDVNGNGLLDPQDLIAAFSDGKDDDGNGYVDDISGWDFFHDDNDPTDDTSFGHGSGSLADSAAEAGNAQGDAGVCPDCTLVMLRVGDAFVPELDTWAMAVVYGVDIGAAVVDISGGGGLDNPTFGRDAMQYAYDNGVTVIASNSDLNSFHHNFPNTSDHAISVHAIRYDSDSLSAATTFFNFNNCTNYGAQLLLSIPADGCSSEAAGRAGGLAGLVYSAALAANLPPPRAFAGDAARARRLSAEEVRQLLIGTVDSFYDPADADDPLKYPTKLGFARRFGYGRPNARGAVDAVLGGRLPPEVELRAPGWFDVIDAGRTPRVTIDGRVAARGRGANPAGVSFDYVVEWAPGVDPADAAFQPIAHAELVSAAVDGPLATWDVSRLHVDNPVPLRGDPAFQPDDPANRYLVTLRLRARLHASDPVLDGAMGEARRALSLYQDPDLLPGFPVRIGASGESSPKIAALDGGGHGARAIVFGDSDGHVHAIGADGHERPGWPVATETLPLLVDGAAPSGGHAHAPGFSGALDPGRHAAIGGSIAVGDVDGDGQPDVVAATWFGAVWAWHGDGRPLAGFPVALDRDSAAFAVDEEHELQDGFFAAPVLVDLDRDGRLDIVAAAMDGKLYAWSGDGRRLSGFPVLVHDPKGTQRQRLMGTPAAGDLNGDGIPDLVLGTNEDFANQGRVYAVDGRGMGAPGGPFLPGWPAAIVSNHILPVVGKGVPSAPALADVDGDGRLEVLVSGIGSVLHVLGRDGKPVGAALANQRARYGASSGARNGSSVMLVASPAVGDLDNDRVPDVIEGGAGVDALQGVSGGQRHDFEHHVAAWDARSGQYKPGFPRVIEDWQFFTHPAIADVDGDGRPEVIAPSAGYFIHAWNGDGKEAARFPKYTGGWALATPAVGDLDGDGRLELAALTRNGWLYAWHLDGKADGRIDWPSYHHDLANSGNFERPLDQGRRAGAGGCTLGGERPRPAGTLALVAFLLVIGHARRRCARHT